MTRSKSPWSSFRFKKSKKEEAEVAGGAAGGGAEAMRDYLEEEDAMRTIGKLLGARSSGLGPEMAGSGSDFSVMASWLRLLILGTLVIFLHEETIHVSKLILLLCVLT